MTRGEALLAWYAAHRRDLPWRHTTDPFRILVSEVMLQQTQVSRVVPAYLAFLERFPDASALAQAPLDQVLDAWQGLGYPVRARRLREAARIVADDGWPTTSEDLQRLPGVGPYTAAAVASFAFGEDVAVVDTNVRRVVSRWRGEPLAGADLDAAASEEVTGPAGIWNQAVMELGALVCRTTPQCDRCPVTAECADPTVYTAPPHQRPYEGSIRQIRGNVLRVLGASTGAVSLESLGTRVAAANGDLERAVDGLTADGLVIADSQGVRLAE